MGLWALADQLYQCTPPSHASPQSLPLPPQVLREETRIGTTSDPAEEGENRGIISPTVIQHDTDSSPRVAYFYPRGPPTGPSPSRYDYSGRVFSIYRVLLHALRGALTTHMV